MDKKDKVVVFKALPGSQSFALDTRAKHTLYCGTRGAAKTATQLMRFRRHVGRGYGSYWRGIIFDREFKNLSDLVAQSKKFFNAFGDGAKFYDSATDYRWKWPTGEELLFRHIKKVGEYENFHGHEYPFIGWNELTKWATLEIYDKMMSTNRSSFISDGSVSPIPLEVFSTTNPSGPGHNAVKRRFIDVAPYGKVVKKVIPIFNPQTQMDETHVVTQIAIFGSYRENKYLSADYVAELTRLTENNPNLHKAWLLGDWDVASGGAFDDLWDPTYHVIPVFQIPENWYVDRSFDWGSARPFSVGWWAEADGTEVELPENKTYLGNNVFCPVKGSLIRIEDLYGSDAPGDNKGLRLSDKKIALRVKNKEIELLEKGRILKQPYPGPADNQIFDHIRPEMDTIAEVMDREVGIKWERSDKSRWSRKTGVQLFRNRLAAAIEGEGPAVYVTDNCNVFKELIPYAPRDEDEPDDVDTDWEDHVWDETRYRILKSNSQAPLFVPVKFPI